MFVFPLTESKEKDDKKSVITMSLMLTIPSVSMLYAIVYAAILLANCAAIIGRPLAGTDRYSEITGGGVLVDGLSRAIPTGCTSRFASPWRLKFSEFFRVLIFKF